MLDVLCIVFACVTANHLGLVGAVEAVIRHRIPVVSCPKCLTFWVVLLYGCFNRAAYGSMPEVVAVALAASYAAIWLELIEGFIDHIYLKLYDKQISTGDSGATAADPERNDADGALPELRQTNNT